ncbi:hypothetical protein [Janthinobacterium tructae]|uniref:Bacteriophage tail tape measure N-terminal domain-containing protein n=1 Tax=Janthinobacterium tructae TaxID=2590869 RepID=A0A4Y6R987_9BURK|nr:hypothetical protein [Janthinobacterium tructae]QDG69429.1 hypothetical protein FJQ89_02625 [Janthinobacterium tructae]
MPDIAQLGLSIDTRQVVEGSKALDSLGEAAVRVEQKTAGATAAVDKLGEASAGAKAKATEGAAAVDALGDAGARVAPKVGGATTSVDSLSAATARVRSTSTEGVSALDNFTNSSAGVWRRGSDAAKSVEALGDATQRTGQRAAISNGQMDDTSKIMRAQAEQARQAAQATTALGGSTTQLTLGQQQLIERMREQAATIGMSRTQLLAYQAAQMGVTQETQRAIATIKAHEDALKAAAKAKEDAARSSSVLADGLKMLGAAYAALKVWDYVKETALLAARYETLGVVMTVVGRNAGYTKTQMITATEAIAAQGITMIESRESAVKLVQAHVDLKNATVLARIAQDAAVIGHLNSSDAFDRLVNGIARGNVLILRNIGINVNLQSAYRQMADELGKTTKELTENERVQARLNAVIDRGSDIAGTYAASMDTAGKQITSMQRYVTDLKTRFGETFNEVLTVSVMALTRSLKDANGEVSELSKNNQLEDWGHNLAATFVWLANTVSNANTVLVKAWAWADHREARDNLVGKFRLQARANDADSSIQEPERVRRAARIESGLQSELAQEYVDYVSHQAKLTGEFDRFAIAETERNATRTARRKSEADARLKVDADYAKAASDILLKSASEGAVAQESARKKVLALYEKTYVGTPTYRDTEGREPKPKADQVENTQLADQIKQYEKVAAVAKAHYDALGKLDDMYLKGGELSVQQAYENKRSYATKTYEAQIDAYDLELDALTSHNSRTSGEAAKHEKQINEILGKRDAAEKAFFDESFRRDEEERLRQAAIATAASDAANKEIAAINAQVAAVEEQIRTYGLLPAQKTALAVADLEEQKAALANFEGNEKVIDGINRKIEAMKRLGIVQGKASTQEQGGDVAKAKELLDILTAVDTATKSAAQGMAASFGAVGTAIGGLTTALSGYAVQQQAIVAQLAAATKDAYGDPTKVAKAQAAAAQQGAQAQIKSYGDMASSAKGFFKENTAGYRAMEGAEKAYRAVEMAMAIESMVKKLFAVEVVTTATLGAEAAKAVAVQAGTATQLAADTVKGTSAAAVAVATQAQGDPYSAWIRMAAMAAAMAALGFAVSGGGGSDTTARDRQAATGTGSILGDSSAKSESIAHSLAIMEKNSGLGLAHTISMDSSLKQMVAGIGNLSSLLARSGVTAAGGGAASGVQTGTTTLGGSLGMAAGTLAGGVGGAALGTYLGMGMAAIGGPLGLAVGAVLGSVLGGVVSKLFNTSTSIKDQGITGKAMSLGNVDALGFTAQAYADVNTKKKAFGISYSSKDSTKTAALSDEMNDQFTMIITSMGDTIRSAADVLGLGGAAFNAHLNSFVVDLGKISLKDLSGEEQQKALETAFSKMGDDMAKFGVAGLAQYQAVGEGYLETLVRVTNDFMQVSDVLAVLGKSFNTTGLGAVALSESLILATGGLEALTNNTGYFVENFLTEAERMAPITKSVNDAMGKLGVSGVTTVDQFKALVLAQDLNTAAGQSMYAQLIAIAEPFKKAADYAAELAAATGDFAAVAKTASEIASEHRDLQQQLNELTKSETELLAIQRSSIAAVNRALFDQVQAAKAVVSAKDALGKAYDREATAAQTALDKSKSWVTTLNGLNPSLALGAQSTLTPEQKYAEARAQFEKTLAAANAGDTTAQSGLSAAEQAFLTASQVVNASDARYAADYARVLAANDEALKWASAQVDVQQASLDALKAQVSGLITINDSVLTVAQAIANLHAAMGTATGLGVKFDGSHAGGLVSTPYDGYIAELHAGEPVIDAPAAAALRRYFGGTGPSQGGGNTAALVAEIKGLREEVKGLRADQAKQTGATIQATVESNDKAAQTVVAGVDKSAKSSAWANTVKGEYA